MFNLDSLKPVLTEREKEILELLKTGATNIVIADTLCISNHTVKTHLENIYLKLGVHNRLQAVIYVMQNL